MARKPRELQFQHLLTWQQDHCAKPLLPFGSWTQYWPKGWSVPITYTSQGGRS